MIAKTSNETIVDLLSKMQPLLLVAGVPKHQIRVRTNKSRIEILSKAFNWLHDLFISPEFEELISVWKLLPEKTWRRYALFEIEGLREQELLKIAKKKVLKKWKTKRPNIFNKDKKKPNPETPIAERVR